MAMNPVSMSNCHAHAHAHECFLLSYSSPSPTVLSRRNPNLQFQIHSSRSSKQFRKNLVKLKANSDRNQNDPIQADNNNNNSLGVKAALSMLRFYKREISPLIPKSCRFVPTCSEYSMEAYNKYGVAKGTLLTAWRLCCCNPLGGSGFDPPRWFGEETPTIEQEEEEE